jgi:hypothetical protein
VPEIVCTETTRESIGVTDGGGGGGGEPEAGLLVEDEVENARSFATLKNRASPSMAK